MSSVISEVKIRLIVLRRKLSALLLKSFDFLQYCIFIIFNLPKEKLCIVDIDNTIACAWPTLINFDGDENERLSRLEYYPSVLNLVIDYHNLGFNVIFLSARHIKYSFTTKKWLKRLPIFKTSFQLYLVSNPYYKLKFLKSFYLSKKMVFLDDLTYNTENGSTLFYKEIIEEVNTLNIVFIDYEKLINLQITKISIYE